MAKTFDKMINELLDVAGYTIEEMALILGVSGRTISNYKEGGGIQKKTRDILRETYEQVSANDMKKIALSKLTKTQPEAKITPDGVLLKVLLQEFADYKAQKEGVNADDVISDIENKARLILKVASKV